MSEPEKTRRDRTTRAPETPEGPRSSATARWRWGRTRHAARGGSGCLRSATQSGDVAQAVARGQASYGASAPCCIGQNRKFSNGRYVSVVFVADFSTLLHARRHVEWSGARRSSSPDGLIVRLVSRRSQHLPQCKSAAVDL